MVCMSRVGFPRVVEEKGMRAHILPSLLLFVLPQCAAPESDLVAVWEFDGTLEDRDGRNQDDLKSAARAYFLNATELPGTKGQAIALGMAPGDADSLSAPTSADVRLHAGYSIEAWVLPVWNGAPPVWNRLVLNWGAAPNYAYHLAFHNGQMSLYHGQADGTWVAAEGGRIQPGRWQHVAGIARRNDADPGKSVLEVYVDGERVGTASYDGSIAAGAATAASLRSLRPQHRCDRCGRSIAAVAAVAATAASLPSTARASASATPSGSRARDAASGATSITSRSTTVPCLPTTSVRSSRCGPRHSPRRDGSCRQRSPRKRHG